MAYPWSCSSFVFLNKIVTDVDFKITLFADDCALFLEMISAEESIVCKKTRTGSVSEAMIETWTTMLLNATH